MSADTYPAYPQATNGACPRHAPCMKSRKYVKNLDRRLDNSQQQTANPSYLLIFLQAQSLNISLYR